MMKLAGLLTHYCRAGKLTLRDLATEIGFSHATLGRFLNGGLLDGKNLAMLIRWLLAEA